MQAELAGETSKYGGCPWRVSNYNFNEGIIGLHEEIVHFYRYMLPTPSEHAARIGVVERIENLIQSLWPQAQLEIFGSFRTGLYLPNSDIDLVVVGLWENLPLRTIQSELVAHGIAEDASIRVLDTAIVPIVKYIDRETKIKVDMSFNTNSVQDAELIKMFKRKYPPLGYLVMVLKQFLRQRNLNEVFTGGLSSYSLILMCISFLQLHGRNAAHRKANLGVLLLEFFELYGMQFNYAKVAISIQNGGRYVPKELISLHGSRRSSLCIDDPLLPGHNIAGGSFAITCIRQAFQWAYRELNQAVSSKNDYIDSCSSSVLGRIIYITDELVDYRTWLHGSFDHLVVVESKATEYVTSSNGEVELRINRSLKPLY